MNPLLRSTLVMSLMFSSAVLFAQNKGEEHAAHQPAGDAPAATAAPSDSKPAGPATMQQMQDNMKKMQEQMAKINSSKDASERQALLAQHMQAMHQQMDMMREMMSGPTMSKPSDGKDGDDTMNCGRMMGGNMDMMKKMMHQMQQHMTAEEKSKVENN